MHATKGCKHQEDACNKRCTLKKMHAPKRSMSPRRCPRRRMSTKMPALQVQKIRASAFPCVRPRDARVGHLTRASASLRASKGCPVGHVMPALATSCPRRPSPASAKDGCVYFDACKDA